MKIINNILSKSNSYNYYKSNFEKLKKENKELKRDKKSYDKKIKELNEKHIREINKLNEKYIHEIRELNKNLNSINDDLKNINNLRK